MHRATVSDIANTCEQAGIAVDPAYRERAMRNASADY
jgi:hypothetical protein